MSTTVPKLIYVIAGEPSGDLLGGRLMDALKTRSTYPINFVGIGGATMTEQGLVSLFPLSELSVMGVVEVLKHAPRLLKRINETIQNILELKPDLVVTIDAPDFTFRVAKKVSEKNPQIKLVHYVAPSVWAWRPGRARKIAKFLDHLLTILPFEPPYFEKEGLNTTFVGHSAIEEHIAGNPERFRETYKISDLPIVMLLPGSRHGEITRLLPIFLETAQALRQQCCEIHITIPILPHLKSLVQDLTANFPLPYSLVEGKQNKTDAFAAARIALATSGTVALELGLAKVPSIICYRANMITAFLAKRLIKLPHVSLVNILLQEEIMPEFMQEEVTCTRLLPALVSIFKEGPSRQKQIEAGAKIAQLLKPGNLNPSQCAADVILRMIGE